MANWRTAWASAWRSWPVVSAVWVQPRQASRQRLSRWVSPPPLRHAASHNALAPAKSPSRRRVAAMAVRAPTQGAGRRFGPDGRKAIAEGFGFGLACDGTAAEQPSGPRQLHVDPCIEHRRFLRAEVDELA